MSLKPSSKIVQKIVDDEASVSKELCRIVSDLAKSAIEEKGSFYVGLSGGSMAKFVNLEFPTIETDFTKWKFFLCDERLVPVDHKDSSLKLYLDGLVGSSNITENQFVTVDTTLNVSSAASDYEEKLREFFPDVTWPSFDLLLLGMGPDGHTASLFPGHPLIEEKTLWIAPISDSPKPPPERVTMTFPVINNAKVCIFAMAGEGKADMLKKVLVDKEDLPSTKVNPSNGQLIWIMDTAAASKL